MSVDDRKPWDKQQGESPKAHAAFRRYLMLPHRALMQVAHDCACSMANVKRWSSHHKWLDRADAWDVHMGQVEQAARERVARDVAETWARRKLEIAEANWQRAVEVGRWAEEAREKAPLFEQEIEHIQLLDTHDAQGNPVQERIPVKLTLKPVKWDMRTVLEAYKTAALLASSAITEATQGIVADDGFDVSRASPDELRAYLTKRGVKAIGP